MSNARIHSFTMCLQHDYKHREKRQSKRVSRVPLTKRPSESLTGRRRYIKVLHDRIRRLEVSQNPSDQGPIVPVQPTPSKETVSFSQLCQIAPKDIAAQRVATPMQSALLPSPVSQIDLPQESTSVRSTSTHQNPTALATPADSMGLTLSSGVPMSTTLPHQEMASTTPGLSHYTSDSDASPTKSAATSLPRDTDGKGHYNAMGIMCSAQSQESPSQTFYGQSSVASLLNHVPLDSARTGGPEQQDATTHPRSARLRGISSIPRHSLPNSSRKIHMFSLPPRGVADELLNHYWSGVHLFYPWIHTQSFLKAYEAIWSPGGSVTPSGMLPRVGLGGSDCSDTVFNLALNAIFALGCEFSDSLRYHQQDPAQEFMDRAFNLLHVELLDSPRLSLVQTLMLAAFYLQSTPQVMRCWSMAGLACRMAQAIGLHLSHYDSGYTELEIEMRRRAWHGCVLMDR